MGAGIAQLAAQAGAQTLLCDAMPEQLQRGIVTIEGALQRQVDKGRIAAGDASAIRARVEPVADLDGLAACGIVIEAVPERLDLKLELFGRLPRSFVAGGERSEGLVNQLAEDLGCVLLTGHKADTLPRHQRAPLDVAVDHRAPKGAGPEMLDLQLCFP